MHIAELRRRVGEILEAEERNEVDRAERLIDDLFGEIVTHEVTECPETVYRYLEDGDIRAQDAAYARHQHEAIRRFVETGEYTDSKPVPRWAMLGCGAVVVVVAALALWLID